MGDLGPDEGLTPALYLIGVTPAVVGVPVEELRRHLMRALSATQRGEARS